MTCAWHLLEHSAGWTFMRKSADFQAAHLRCDDAPAAPETSPVVDAPAPEPTTATPTPAPTPTPTPSAPSPSSPAPSTPSSGSAGFAGPGNTGPAAAGFKPSVKYTGPMRITTSGTVVKGQIIPAGLVVVADDVTVQGNLVVGSTSVPDDEAAIRVEGDNAHILDNEIRGNSATSWSQDPASGVKITGDNVLFQRNDMLWIAGDGLSVYGDNSNVTGNWIHDFVLRSGVHYDAVVYAGGDSDSPALVKGNRVELWTSDGMTAALSFPDHSPNIRVDGNLLAGGNYTILGGGGGITITNNLFWTKFSPHVGYYGLQAHMGNVQWSDNHLTSDGVTRGAVATF